MLLLAWLLLLLMFLAGVLLVGIMGVLGGEVISSSSLGVRGAMAKVRAMEDAGRMSEASSKVTIGSLHQPVILKQMVRSLFHHHHHQNLRLMLSLSLQEVGRAMAISLWKRWQRSRLHWSKPTSSLLLSGTH